MTKEFEIRGLLATDKEQWLDLWQGYLTFYESELPSDETEHTWQRIIEGTSIYGLCAVQGKKLLGFTHFIFHPSTWSKNGYCYLEDLFTAPQARGQGVGRALIESVRDVAIAKRSDRLYWHTKTNNVLARALYDKLASEAGFVQYRM